MARAKTIPPKYHRPLTAEQNEARAALEKHQDDLDRQIDSLLAMPRSIPTTKKILALRREVRRVDLSLTYQGADPKRVPKADLKEIVNGPVGGVVEDQYRDRIRNRGTAIRAYCVVCVSGQPVMVRECPAITCPLWPFRMGTDPLRGYDIPKLHVELDAEADEDDALFEEGEDDNGDPQT